MKRLIAALLGLFLVTSCFAQCDLSINNWNPISGDLVIDVINSENCGCNDFTNIDNVCENSASPVVNNNETVSHIVLGLHLDGYDYDWGCVSGVNHPGWTFKVFSLYGNSVLESGESWSGNVYDFSTAVNDCWEEILANDTACVELVIWQINLSRTAGENIGGWAANPSANQTQNYPDVNVFNNATSSCPPPDAPDAVVSYVEFETGCIGDDAYYEVSYFIWNYGQDTITDYCIEIWNEDIYDCYDSNSAGNGNLEIPPGFGQSFTSPIIQGPWFEGQFFGIEVSDVNDEIVTGNNITTVYMPPFIDCPIECVNDTIIEYVNVTDTLYVDVLVYVTDTLYVELPNDTIFIEEYIYITDTLYVDVLVYVTDTIFIEEYIYITDTVEVLVDNYIYVTDTITEYEIDYIDCDTGLPCGEEPPGIDCSPWSSIYVPNTFTPNNDGVNDVWQLVYELDCWVDVEFKIFNRWGAQIYHGYGSSFDSYPFWDGSVHGGTHLVPDGVYYYSVVGRKANSPEVINESGHITIFR